MIIKKGSMSVIFVATTIVLTGCGGNDDDKKTTSETDNQPSQTALASITPENARKIASNVYQSQAMMSWAGGQLFSKERAICGLNENLQKSVGAIDLTVWIFKNILEQADTLFADGEVNWTGVKDELKEGVGTFSCDSTISSTSTGSMDTKLQFSREGWWPEVSASTHFNNCGVDIFDGTTKVDGGISMGFEKDTTEGSYKFKIAFDETHLAFPNNHSFYALSGGFQVGLQTRRLWPLEFALIVSGDQLSANFGDDRVSLNGEKCVDKRDLSDFEVALDINATTNKYTYSYSGKLLDSNADPVRYKTQAAFQGFGSETPVTGSMEIYGKNSSKMVVETNDGSVFLKLDSNGDGVIEPEHTQTYTWEEFLNSSK
jgi:hypothetical protein